MLLTLVMLLLLLRHRSLAAHDATLMSILW
jgi:hypothetical protein